MKRYRLSLVDEKDAEGYLLSVRPPGVAISREIRMR